MAENEKVTVEDEIREALLINDDDLIKELKEQPSLYFYYSALWSRAAKKRRTQKMQLKEVEARLGKVLRERVRADDIKAKVSERMLDDYLAEQEEYKQILRDYTQAEYVESLLEVAKDAFKQRGQLLVELSRSNRDEKVYGNEMNIMKAEMERRDEKVKAKRSKRQPELIEDTAIEHS